MRKLFLISLPSFLVFLSCQAPLPKNDFFWASNPNKITELQIVDIAVLPPRDSTPARESMVPGILLAPPPLEEFRLTAYKELIQRRYSPLALDYIDRSLLGKSGPVEASYQGMRGRWGEDAVLGINVNRWENSRTPTTGLISIGAEVYILDAKSGVQIWQAKADRDFNLSKDRDFRFLDADQLTSRAIQRFMKRILQEMPNRVVLEGR